jgi:hypothetical protein
MNERTAPQTRQPRARLASNRSCPGVHARAPGHDYHDVRSDRGPRAPASRDLLPRPVRRVLWRRLEDRLSLDRVRALAGTNLLGPVRIEMPLAKPAVSLTRRAPEFSAVRHPPARAVCHDRHRSASSDRGPPASGAPIACVGRFLWKNLALRRELHRPSAAGRGASFRPRSVETWRPKAISCSNRRLFERRRLRRRWCRVRSNLASVRATLCSIPNRASAAGSMQPARTTTDAPARLNRGPAPENRKVGSDTSARQHPDLPCESLVNTLIIRSLESDATVGVRST